MPTTTTEVELKDCDVVTLRVTEDHQICLRFRDGLVAELNLADLVASRSGPVVEPLRDPAYFALATITDGVVTWPNGYDLDPVDLRTWAERGWCEI
ncbi:MAG: DUF2442 domain-containing protein [Prosthecobacter sp.]|nr:DUF2442 domain-containing protein [Prosthecobacter sp.]